MRPAGEIVSARVALGVALVLAWLNFLFTVKWAAVSGALNGWKRPWYGAALVTATVLTLVAARRRPVQLRGLPWLVAGASAFLLAAFVVTFPPATWRQLPFSDDWVPRFQSTVDGIALLRRGAVVGWQWAFLGGYQSSGDLTQSLTLIGILPMTLLGDRLGFHLMHLGLLAAIPFLVYRDIASEGHRDVAWLSALFAVICAAGMFGTIMPSGDTNSIAGVLSALVALTGSRIVATSPRSGAALLIGGLTLALYSHAAFFLYAFVYLLLEAALYRSVRMAGRAVLASLIAVGVSLPQHFELLRYSDFFITNNLMYGGAVYDLPRMARKIFYNVEILFHPHRWFNDYLSMTCVFLPVFIWVALQPGRTRPRFYAWIVLATMAMLRLDMPETGFLLTREMHMLAAVAPVPLAWFVIEASGDRRLAWALVALIGLYQHSTLAPIPHVDHVREFDEALTARLATLDGARVLLESSPHRDLDADPVRRTQRTPFHVHFEAYLPEATGKLYYGQQWDTWHWTPFRGQVVAGGAFRGQLISHTPVDQFEAEMRKWGVRHLVVWSDATRQYLDAAPERFRPLWRGRLWVHYEMKDADTRSVVVDGGTGTLDSPDPLGADVRLSSVRADSVVVVRTNYFPAWTAVAGGRDVPLFARDGQLAFRAPDDGSYVVRLEYPRRRGLMLLAILLFLAGTSVVSKTCATPSSLSAAA